MTDDETRMNKQTGHLPFSFVHSRFRHFEALASVHLPVLQKRAWNFLEEP
jgi:hypothetical protein